MNNLLWGLIIFLSLSFSSVRGEELAVLSEEEKGEFLEQVQQDFASTHSLRAQFIQEREMAVFEETLRAKGECFFEAPEKLRWQVNEPYSSTMIYNDGEVEKFVYDDGKARRVDVGGREVMREVMGMIAKWMQGSFESSEDIFAVQVRHNGKVLVELTPRHEEMKEMMDGIELRMDPKTKLIQEVKIKEARGDVIRIQFIHQQTNVEIKDSLFESPGS